MSSKIAIVVDKSEAFIALQKERVLDGWEVNSANLKKIERIGEAGGITLFGGGMTSLLELPDADAVKQCFEEMSELNKKDELEAKLLDGVLIVSSVPRTSTKKLEGLVAELGGDVFITTPDKKDRQTVSEKLVQELKLNSDTRNFLLSYVGDDYESLIPLIKTLSKLSPEQQRAVSESDIYVRLPQAPGSRPPWEIEKPLFGGNITDTIDIFRRVSMSTSFLVVLAVLRNKLQLVYRVAALQELNPRITTKQLAEELAVPDNYPLKLALGNAKKYGLKKSQRAVEIIAKTEAEVKGGSGVNPMANMELMLVRLADIFANPS